MPEVVPNGDSKVKAAESILARVAKADLLPPERFKGEPGGKVVEIKQLEKALGVLRKYEDHYEISLYDERGNERRTNLDPSSRELIKATDARWLRIADIGSPPSDRRLDPGIIFGTLGFSDTERVVLKRRWYAEAAKKFNTQSDSNGYVNKADIGNSPLFYIPVGEWKLEVRQIRGTGRGGKQEFIARVGDTFFSILPEGGAVKKQALSSEAVGPDRDAIVGGLQLTRESPSLFTIADEQTGEVHANFSGTDFAVDPGDPDILFFISGGKIQTLDLKGVQTRESVPIIQTRFKVEAPVEIDFDPSGNFLFVRSQGKLVVLEKETGDEVRTFDNVTGPILVDSDGDIIYAEENGRVREIQTNFQSIPRGGSEAASRKRQEELEKIERRFEALKLEDVEKAKPAGTSEEKVAETLRATLSREVDAKIDGAAEPEAIEQVLDQLTTLKSDPANKEYGHVFDEFAEKARGKLSQIQTARLRTGLDALSQRLEAVKSVGDTIGLDEVFARILQQRQRTEILDVNVRREIEQVIERVQVRKDELTGRYQTELLATIEQTLPGIEALIDETGSAQELGAFGATATAQQFERMLANIKDPQVRKEWRERLNQIKDRQRSNLEARNRELEDKQRLNWAQVIEEARQDLEAIRDEITRTSELKDVDRFGRSPLITIWRSKLLLLPPELREIEEKKLEVLLSSRKQDLEHRKSLGAVGETGELRFGEATFPIYKEPPKIWQPKLLPLRRGEFSDWAELVFADSQGRVWKPDSEVQTVVANDLGNERTKALVEKYRLQAEEYFRSIKRRVPDFDEHWRITEYHMQKLQEIVETLNLQSANHKGILILQGEAGTGKNVVVDMLANLSNREVVPILCNEHSSKEDLTYEFYYDPEKGTYKLPSKLVEALQTPGAIILFDEINALKPGIAKLLNSLFDYRRRIYLAEGGREREIIVDPTVLFIGTMNPQNYEGVHRLSPEVKSRARVIDVDYPPFEDTSSGRTVYQSHEAEMLAASMDSLSGLKPGEFRLCWNYLINRDTTNGAEMILQGDAAIEMDVKRIYDVLRVANKLRDMYQAFKLGDSNEEMDFPVSLREVIDIVLEMNHRRGVKDIVKRVIVPKIDDDRQKRLVRQTIDAILPDTPANP